MMVVGPTGNRVRLPAPPGRTYPGFGIVERRSSFDATLRLAAIEAGAEFFDGRADEPLGDDGRLDGFSLSSKMRIRADVIVGADGATSRVAEVAGLVDPGRVLWGFAVRTYLDEPVELPHIMLWTPVPGAGFPGYGWVFPAGEGRANVGLGVGVLADRTAGRRAARPRRVSRTRVASVFSIIAAPVQPRARPLGAWLKMGLVGTTPARDRVFLVGDAAGLVNPLQGEGIAQAMDSGRAAAVAILGGIEHAPGRYRALGAHARAVPVDDGVRPPVAAPQTQARGRAHPRLTAPGVGRSLAGGWSIMWNNLLDGAPPSVATGLAATAAGLGHVLTARSTDRRWIASHLGDSPATGAKALRPEGR